MKSPKLFSGVVIIAALALVAFLLGRSLRLEKEVRELRSIALSATQQATEAQYIIHMFLELAPQEMARVAREVVREELGREPLKEDLLDMTNVNHPLEGYFYSLFEATKDKQKLEIE